LNWESFNAFYFSIHYLMVTYFLIIYFDTIMTYFLSPHFFLMYAWKMWWTHHFKSRLLIHYVFRICPNNFNKPNIFTTLVHHNSPILDFQKMFDSGMRVFFWVLFSLFSMCSHHVFIGSQKNPKVLKLFPQEEVPNSTS
jgi:hypothetical protein